MAIPPALRWLIQVSMRSGLGFDWISVPGAEGTQVMIWTGDYELRKLTVSWSRTPSVGVVQDRDQCTFHFLNLTGGDPDDTWVDADFTTIESAFDTFWTSQAGKWSPEVKLAEYAWRKDGPAFRPFGEELSPTVRIVARSTPGANSPAQILPPQCAMSVTEVTAAHYLVHGVGVPGHAPGTGRTQQRNRWGRFYLPALSVDALTDGRFLPSVCTAISNAVKTMYNTCVAADLIPVMYSPTTGSTWSIDSVHVDDIVDVIRSRRYITPITRAPNAIDAP